MCGVHSYLVDHSYYHIINTLQVLTYGTPLLSSTVDEFQALENDPEYQKMTQQVATHYYALHNYTLCWRSPINHDNVMLLLLCRSVYHFTVSSWSSVLVWVLRGRSSLPGWTSSLTIATYSFSPLTHLLARTPQLRQRYIHVNYNMMYFDHINDEASPSTIKAETTYMCMCILYMCRWAWSRESMTLCVYHYSGVPWNTWCYTIMLL